MIVTKKQLPQKFDLSAAQSYDTNTRSISLIVESHQTAVQKILETIMNQAGEEKALQEIAEYVKVNLGFSTNSDSELPLERIFIQVDHGRGEQYFPYSSDETTWNKMHGTVGFWHAWGEGPFSMASFTGDPDNNKEYDTTIVQIILVESPTPAVRLPLIEAMVREAAQNAIRELCVLGSSTYVAIPVQHFDFLYRKVVEEVVQDHNSVGYRINLTSPIEADILAYSELSPMDYVCVCFNFK